MVRRSVADTAMFPFLVCSLLFTLKLSTVFSPVQIKAPCMQITPLHRAWDLLLAFPSYLAWRTCIPSCSSSVMRAILLCLHNPNKVKALWLCTHFYFLLFASHAVYRHLLSASSHAALIVRVWECLLSCCPPRHICFYPLCPYFFSSYGSSFLLSRLASCLQRYLCHPWSDLPHSSSVLLTLQTVSHCHKQKLYQQQMTFSNILIWWMNWLLLQCFLLTDRIKKTSPSCASWFFHLRLRAV